MSRFLNRRTMGLLGLALTVQLLSACVVVPVPHHARGPSVVVDVESDRGHHHRGHDRRRGHRDYRH